jgi:asparagine N-glycosylation enzyme membrane subunit Stt3
VVVYIVAQSLVGDVPAIVGSIIMGLVFAFIYATNKTVRDAINSWLKKK